MARDVLMWDVHKWDMGIVEFGYILRVANIGSQLLELTIYKMNDSLHHYCVTS